MTRKKQPTDPQEVRTSDTKSPDPTPAAVTPKRTSPAIEFLPVPYTDAEVIKFADSIGRYSNEKQQAEEQFEVIKLDFKHKLEALDATIRDITRKITKRQHYENVDCFYILEDPSPREKTLVRRDTAEVVRVVPMDRSDYQDRLPIAMRPEDPVDKTDSFTLSTPPNGKSQDQETPAPAETSTPPIH
jgi:hypothetical protein